MVEYISYNMGTRDLPDIYARALGLGQQLLQYIQPFMPTNSS